MNKAAKQNFLLAGIFLIIAVCCAIFEVDKNTRTEFPDYKNGEILYPDMVHDDTLTVIDADGLNQAATYWDGSDSDINEALHLFCK
jgi:hypothetical protein